MSENNHFTKIGASGEQLPKDATEWEAVLDSRTGLMWPADDIHVPNQHAAEGAVKELAVAGFADWRMPTVEEMFLLPDRNRHNPAIDTDFFPECKSDWYWTSTPYAPSPGDCAWGVGFDSGLANWDDRVNNGFVRAVRAGQS